MYDIKIYEDGKERETIRGLSLAQASALQRFLDRKGIKHTVKRLTPRAVDLPNESRQPSWCDEGLDDAVIGSLP